MKLKVLLMTLVFAVSMVAQTAAPVPAPEKQKTDCSCPTCKDCCKDGKCASGGKCCGSDAKCVRKSGDKMAKADCCAGKKDCCKDGKCMNGGKCCGDMAKSETAKKDAKGDCCGGKCDRKGHHMQETKPGV
jgi:hypothetical protein